MRFPSVFALMVITALGCYAADDAPVPLAPIATQTTYVTSTFSLDLSDGNQVGVTYHTTGLPKGLTLDKATGQITGVISAKPGTYSVKYWTQNGSAKSPVQTASFVINAFPAQMTGSFESLLDGVNGSGFLAGKVQIKVTSAGAYTGKLTTYDKQIYALRGQLNLRADNSAGHSILVIKRPSGAFNIVPDITFPPDTTYIVSIDVQNDSTLQVVMTLSIDSSATSGFEIGFDGKGARTMASNATSCPWKGIYTLTAAGRPELLYVDGSIDNGFPGTVPHVGPMPAGASYATAKIAANGTMAIKGKTADGTPFTASLSSGYDASYRAYIKPYKTDGSYLGGRFSLTERSDSTPTRPVYHIDGNTHTYFYWNKEAAPTDKTYPEGFSVFNLGLSAEPWNPSASLAGTFPLIIDGAGISNDSTNPDNLPVSFTLNAQSIASLAAPSDLANPSKWTLKVTPSTGVFNGSFNVTRTINGQATTLKVPFEGVLQQPFSSNSSYYALSEGFFLLPPNDDTGATAVSGSIQISTP